VPGRSSRENHTPAVMLLDLNGFKEVNDTSVTR
jgi:GGDEF domain-containing protein